MIRGSAHVPMILETPKGIEEGEDLDARNLRILLSASSKVASEAALSGRLGAVLHRSRPGTTPPISAGHRRSIWSCHTTNITVRRLSS